MNSLRHALRSLGRTPVFTAAAIGTLVLGIASVAAMFAIVYGVLLAPLRFGHPDRLVSIDLQARSGEARRIQQSPGIYFTFARFARRFDAIGFYRVGSANIWTDGGPEQPERVTASWMTASTIPLLQATPLIGRAFTAEEDRAHGPNVAVISEAIWRTRFRADTGVIGKTLIVNAVPRTIVGVMPDGFHFPAAETRIWLPARLDPSIAALTDFGYASVARLAPGATPDAADRELLDILPRIAESYPRLESGTPTVYWLNETHPTPIVVPLRDEMTGGIARTLWVLAAAAALVLLVAGANVANLMLIRADGRQLELAVREALGASRLRILSHFLGEATVLAAVAGVIALPVAWAAVRALVAFGPADVPRLVELNVGPSTVGFVIIVSAITALLCAAVPAFRSHRGSWSINLRDGARGETAGRSRQRLRATMATLQMAISLVVLAGSALLLRTLQRLYDVRPGFDATNVVTIQTQLPFARYGDSSSVRFYGRLTSAVGNLAGVRAAGVTTRVPLGDGEVRQLSFRVEDDARVVSLPIYATDGGYFDAMRIALIAGRTFEPLGAQRDGDVIVSQRAATALWNDPTGRRAIGKRLSLAPIGPTYTVIGVVADVRDDDLATPPAATVYMPQVAPIDPAHEPAARRAMALVVKTAGPPTAIVPAVRRVLRDLDPTVPSFDIETMEQVVRASTARLSLTLALMSAAAVITLLLGAIGLYGVMAYVVALRTRELGVRVALGADPRTLARQIVWRGLRLIGIGVVVGLVLFAAAARFLTAFLYEVPATDPIPLGGAILALVITASLATWLPARRAAQVDPAQAMRAE